LEEPLCYHTMFGVTRGISDLATLEKLCRLTLLHRARLPHDRRSPP
jgi:hypothetical protein